jgi:cysteinyl-tRNA synthetase
MDLYLNNTLTRKKEKFVPINPPKVGLYTCGPTVYFYPQIGNWRTFIFGDLLRRVLQYNDYDVIHVMNATDVGHLTGDNMGDADLGEDRMEKAAKKEGKTAWDIADFYIKDFLESREKFNILAPKFFVRATEHIPDQINLIKRLEEKGITYVTDMGVYFDVSKFSDYGRLGGQKMIDKRVATREELKEDPQKKNPFDFALWKFSLLNEKRHMEWDSPWGKGYPGWHIECSAMSMRSYG